MGLSVTEFVKSMEGLANHSFTHSLGLSTYPWGSSRRDFGVRISSIEKPFMDGSVIHAPNSLRGNSPRARAYAREKSPSGSVDFSAWIGGFLSFAESFGNRPTDQASQSFAER